MGPLDSADFGSDDEEESQLGPLDDEDNGGLTSGDERDTSSASIPVDLCWVPTRLESTHLPHGWLGSRPFVGPWQQAVRGDDAKELARAMNRGVNAAARSYEQAVYWPVDDKSVRGEDASGGGFKELLRQELSELQTLRALCNNSKRIAKFNISILSLNSSGALVDPVLGAVRAIAKSSSGRCIFKLRTLRDRHGKNCQYSELQIQVPAARGLVTKEINLKLRPLGLLLHDMILDNGLSEFIRIPRFSISEGSRVFSDFMDGDLASEVFKNVRERFAEIDCYRDEEVVVLFVSLGIDGSPVNNTSELVPITCRIMNYSRRVRASSHRLVGYVQQVKFETPEMGRSVNARYSKRFVLASQFRFLLNEFGKLQRESPIMMHGMLVYPVLSLCNFDMKEKVNLLNISGGYNHCANCFACKPFVEYGSKSMRNAGITAQILEWSRSRLENSRSIGIASLWDGGGSQADILFKACGHHVEGEQEAQATDAALNYCQAMGLHGICPPDLLHTVRLGTLKKIFQFFVQAMSGDSVSAQDIHAATDISRNTSTYAARQKLSKVPLLSSIRKMAALLNVDASKLFAGGKTAKQYSNDLHVILCTLLVARGEDFDEFAEIKTDRVRLVLGQTLPFLVPIGWSLIADSVLHRREHTEGTLRNLDVVLQKVFELELGLRQIFEGSSGQSLKGHSLAHLPHFIRQYGNGLEIDTADTEADHKVNVKPMARCSRQAKDVSSSALLRKVEVDRAKSVLSLMQQYEYKGVHLRTSASHHGKLDERLREMGFDHTLEILSDDLCDIFGPLPPGISRTFKATVQVPFAHATVHPMTFSSLCTSRSRMPKDALYRDAANNLFVVILFAVDQSANTDDDGTTRALVYQLKPVSCPVDEREEASFLDQYIFFGEEPTDRMADFVDVSSLLPVTAFNVGELLYVAYPQTGLLFPDEEFVV